MRVGADAERMIGTASGHGSGAGRILDVTDHAATRALLEELRPRAIIHLASVVGQACDSDPAAAERVNVEGTAALVEAADAVGVERFVLASTAAVYGTAGRRPVTEADDPAPAGVYGATKRRAEEAVERGRGSMAADALRIFNVYGPELPDSLITRLQNATEEAPVRLNGVDGFVRDYVHVDDVARALLAAAGSAHSGFRVLNVGSGIPRSNRDLLEALTVPASAVVIGPEVDSYSCADITEIQRELSWRPTEPWPPRDETP